MLISSMQPVPQNFRDSQVAKNNKKTLIAQGFFVCTNGSSGDRTPDLIAASSGVAACNI